MVDVTSCKNKSMSCVIPIFVQSGHKEETKKKIHPGHVLQNQAIKMLLRAHDIEFVPTFWIICESDTESQRESCVMLILKDYAV